MNNLAAMLQAQGDLAGARGLHQQVLDLSRRVLGEEHPDTTISAFNLLVTLVKVGEPESARSFSPNTWRGCRSATRRRWAPINARYARSSSHTIRLDSPNDAE